MNSLPLKSYLDHLGPLAVAFNGNPDNLIGGATADSRQVRSRWLFIAVPGQRDDGTRYIADAIANGAAAIAATVDIALPPGIAFIKVAEAYSAAARLAETMYNYPARQLRLLGITGTNGKTTSAYLLRDILRAAGRKAGMIGTVAYDLGAKTLEADRTTPTPFVLQDILRRMVQAGLQDVVMEVSSHALDQHRVGTAAFAGAIFTNLTGDHADYHKTMENYFAAKARLFTEYLLPGAPAVINVDDPWGKRLADELRARPGGASVISLGRKRTAAARLAAIENTLQGSRIKLSAFRTACTLDSPLIGAFNAYNVGGVAALALALGLPVPAIRDTVAAFAGAPGRLQPIKTASGAVIFVDYAHTDDALKNVLETLRLLKPERLLVLFGCGGDRDRTKRPRMGKVAADLADIVYLTSDNPRGEDPLAILAEIRAGIPADRDDIEIADRHEAIRHAVADAGPGDILLVAGKGHEIYQEVRGVQTHFNDVEEVRAALASAGSPPTAAPTSSRT